MTQPSGEVKDSQPSRKSAQGPRYCSGTLYVGTHRLRGIPLALVPSSSPHFPAPPHLLPKETTQINNFCLVDELPHPTCSPRVMPANPNPAVTWELLVPDYSSLGSLNKVLLEGRGVLPILVPTVPSGGCKTNGIA